MIVLKSYHISAPNTEIEVTYTAGVLTDIKVIWKADDPEFIRIMLQLSTEPVAIEGCVITEIKIQTEKQKIALWCQLYKMAYGTDYKVTQREAGMIKNMEMTQELISAFFSSTEWWAKEKTIQRFTSNYNELKRTCNHKQQASGTGSGGKNTNHDALADEFQRRYRK